MYNNDPFADGSIQDQSNEQIQPMPQNQQSQNVQSNQQKKQNSSNIRQIHQTPPSEQFQNGRKPLKEDPIVVYKAVAGENQAQDYDIEKELSLLIRGKYKCLKLNSTQTQIFPVMLSMKTEQMKIKMNAKDLPQDMKKPPIDLICVIDRSGSMAGQKIQLVQQTLNLLLDFLSDQDRLCLIEFDDRATTLTGLQRLSEDNIKSLFPQVIMQITDRGGTNIAAGMEQAFQVIKERKFSNPVTSIFLLSDGLDGGAQARVEQNLNNNDIKDIFTIHTFGFGKDHDPQLMSDIAKIKNGNFYYIEQLDKVDECFIDALAGLVSVVAQNISISVKPIFKTPFSDCKVSKYFGDMWKNQNELKQINITNLISGVQKDFILEISVPPITQIIDDMERNALFLEVTIQAQSVDLTQTITKVGTLGVTFYNQNEDVPNFEEDPEVMFNYLRVHAAEKMKEARNMSEQGQFEQAQSLMDGVLNQISMTKQNDPTKLNILKQDVEEVRKNCQSKVYNKGSRNHMMQMEQCWNQQQSRGIQQFDTKGIQRQDMYSNNVQMQYQQQVLSRKNP